MTIHPLERSTEAEQVLGWRFHMFNALGVETAEAVVLAESEMDTHDLETLLVAGCPMDVAIQILR